MSPIFTPIKPRPFACTRCLDPIPFNASRNPCKQCPAVLCAACTPYHYHGERNPRIRLVAENGNTRPKVRR